MLQSFPDDILSYFCESIDSKSLKQISLVNKTLRDAAFPLVFRKVWVTGTWEAVEAQVVSLLKRPDIYSVIRDFNFDVFGPMATRMAFIPEFASQLAELISRMNLKSLGFSFSEKDTIDMFAVAFSCFTFPSITTLALDSFSVFLIPLCPSLTDVSSNEFWDDDEEGNDSHALVESVAGRPLRSFGITGVFSTLHTMEAVLKALPCLSLLDLYGYQVYVNGSIFANFYNFIPILGGFTALTWLRLPSAERLGVGFRPPRGRRLSPGTRETVSKQQKEAETRVVKELAAACKQLEVVTFSSYQKVKIRRDQDGKPVSFFWVPR